jgi:Cu+-exporting ATPase
MNQAAVIPVEPLYPCVAESPRRFRLDLYLKGIKCSHCVYKITQSLENQSQLDQFQFHGRGERLSLWVEKQEDLKSIINSIHALGFETLPLTQLEDEEQKRREFKSEIKKLAVAGVCAGNIMLFSTAIYFGATPDFTSFFHKLSAVLMAPVLLYSAQSIWFGFFQSLIHFKFNLDFPIGLALVVGTLLSGVSLLQGADTIYFDSMAVVVFLILASRFVLNRYVHSIELRNIVHLIPGVYQARVMVEGAEKAMGLNEVRPGDQVLVKRGEIFPVDGPLQSDEALINNAVLTGESEPQLIKKGGRVFAGSQLCFGEVLVMASEVAEKTRVGQSIQNVQKQQKKMKESSFQLVSYFTSFVVISALATFFIVLAFLDFASAYQRAFAIILVACPCAISFGLPLIRSFSGQLAMKNGIIVKEPQSLKKAAKIRQVFLDKTGTLTEPSYGVNEDDFRRFSLDHQEKILSLELSVDHPISKGFHPLLQSHKLHEVKDFKYQPGLGIQGVMEGELWQIQSHENPDKTKRVEVFKNHQSLGTLRLQSTLKSGLSSFFHKLGRLGYQISILSGDQSSQVDPLIEMIPKESQGPHLSKATSEEKARKIKSFREPSLMVGDGINDLEAMKEADLSLSMPGALENNIHLADIILTKGDLGSIFRVFQLSKKILSTETRLFTFTFIYNIFCIVAASLGYITPVAAAILMPISSITVLTLVTMSFRRL